MKNWRGVGLVLSLVFVGLLIGCKPRYKLDQVEHRLEGSGPNIFLKAKVRGKAADLAVMLLDPNGESIAIGYISKTDLIDNVEEVTLRFQPKRRGAETGAFSESKRVSAPKPGEVYVLVIKTIDPEKVVYKEKLKFMTAKISIDNVIVLSRHYSLPVGIGTTVSRYKVDKVQFRVKKEGDCPVVLDKALIIIGDQRQEVTYFLGNEAIVGEEEIIEVGLYPAFVFEQQGVYLVTVRLYFIEGNKSVSFETAAVIPFSPEKERLLRELGPEEKESLLRKLKEEQG